MGEGRTEAEKLKAEVKSHCSATVGKQAASVCVEVKNGTPTVEGNLAISIKL